MYLMSLTHCYQHLRLQDGETYMYLFCNPKTFSAFQTKLRLQDCVANKIKLVRPYHDIGIELCNTRFEGTINTPECITCNSREN